MSEKPGLLLSKLSLDLVRRTFDEVADPELNLAFPLGGPSPPGPADAMNRVAAYPEETSGSRHRS